MPPGTWPAWGADYGIRHELPNFLKSSMSALQSISWELRQKHPESRRNVLFDDQALDLVLDFCPSEGASWRQISASQAKEKKKTRSNDKFVVHDDEIDVLLGRGTWGDAA